MSPPAVQLYPIITDILVAVEDLASTATIHWGELVDIGTAQPDASSCRARYLVREPAASNIQQLPQLLLMAIVVVLVVLAASLHLELVLQTILHCDQTHESTVVFDEDYTGTQLLENLHHCLQGKARMHSDWRRIDI